MYTATGIVRDSHPIPFSPTVPYAAQPTLCVNVLSLRFYNSILTVFSQLLKSKSDNFLYKMQKVTLHYSRIF